MRTLFFILCISSIFYHKNNLCALQISSGVRQALQGSVMEEVIYKDDIYTCNYELSMCEISCGLFKIHGAEEGHNCVAFGSGILMTCTYRACNGVWLMSEGMLAHSSNSFKTIIRIPVIPKHKLAFIDPLVWRQTRVSSFTYNRGTLILPITLQPYAGSKNLYGNVVAKIGGSICMLPRSNILDEDTMLRLCRHLSVYGVYGYRFVKWYSEKKPLAIKQLKYFGAFVNSENMLVWKEFSFKPEVQTTYNSNDIGVTLKTPPGTVKNLISTQVSATPGVHITFNQIPIDCQILKQFYYYGMGIEIYQGRLEGLCTTIALDLLWNDAALAPFNVQAYFFSMEDEELRSSIMSKADNSVGSSYENVYVLNSPASVVYDEVVIGSTNMMLPYNIPRQNLISVLSLEFRFSLCYQSLSGAFIGLVVKTGGLNIGVRPNTGSIYRMLRDSFVFVGITCGAQI